MENGYIKLHRKLIKWEWYKKSEMVHLFLHFLLLANHEDNKWQGQIVKKGQFITGRKSLSEDTGISEQTIRTCINALKSTNEITTKPTNKYTIITIVNWETYQNKPTSKSTNKLTNNQPTTNQQLTTNKNDKNIKNDKNTISNASVAGKEINDLMELFKSVNPTYSRLYADKTQRSCLERLLKLMGREKLEGAIKTLEKTNQIDYAPQIFTPYDLEKKLGVLISFVQKEKLKTNMVLKI